MEYKVGDKIKIKTWDTLVEEFDIDGEGNILIPEKNYWDKDLDDELPKDRIITVDHIDDDGDICYGSNWETYILKGMIKEKVEENMKYKENDRVLIKSWTEMKKEFGTDERGYILVGGEGNWWSESDDKLLPENRIITVTDKDYSNAFKYIYGEGEDPYYEWIFAEMVKEKVEENMKYKRGDKVVVKAWHEIEGNSLWGRDEDKMLPSNRTVFVESAYEDSIFYIDGEGTYTAIPQELLESKAEGKYIFVDFDKEDFAIVNGKKELVNLLAKKIIDKELDFPSASVSIFDEDGQEINSSKFTVRTVVEMKE